MRHAIKKLLDHCLFRAIGQEFGGRIWHCGRQGAAVELIFAILHLALALVIGIGVGVGRGAGGGKVIMPRTSVSNVPFVNSSKLRSAAGICESTLETNYELQQSDRKSLDKVSAQSLRRVAAATMRADPEKYRVFVTEDFDNYVARIEHPAVHEWGGQLELR